MRKRDQKYFNKGEERLTKEFDAVHYVKSIRNLNTLVASMLNDNEKLLIKYQKSNLIELESNESGSSDESNEDEIPRLFSNNNHKAKHKAEIDKFMVIIRFLYGFRRII